MGFRKIAFGAFGYVYEYKYTLAKALLIPFALYMTLDAVEILEPSFIASIGFAIAYLMIQTLFAITTHRVILLGPESVPKWGVLKWSKRETFFALHILGLAVLTGILGGMVTFLVSMLIPFANILGWGSALIFIGAVAWLFARLALVFPAIAIDQGVSFKYSWKLTKNHQFLMVLVVVIFPALLLIPAYLLSSIQYSFILTSFLSSFATVFMVAALSVAYKMVCEEIYES